LRENKSQGILGILESITVIKSFIREDIESEKQLGLQNDLTAAQMRTRKISFLFDGFKGFMEQIGIVIIIILTSFFVLKGEMTIGSIMFHILLFNNVSAPIRQLHRIYDQMNDALIYSEGFFDILKADHQIEQSGNYVSDQINGKFEIRNVDFTYPGNTKQTLRKINMDILPGKVTALVGLSGAGKSTLINLLDKFYLPDSGEILLDGVSLNDYDTDFLRNNIGLVLQRNHIFNGTIEENIRYGNPNASMEEVIEAAKKSYIHDQIMTLPNKYETSALSLSGGQQQKIAIARMFLKNPPIIFLDEPTASLDAVSTEQIKNSLDAVKKNRTVIIISHSISQIIDSDRIYVMEEGFVVESGTHEEIYRQNGAYKKIFDAMARSLNIGKISKTLK
jgi:ABC-type multidrug transport system fused ATPase/permease subunit